MQLILRSLPAALEVIKNQVLELLEHNPTPVVLIDGRAGSGKSTFAKNLVDKLFQDGESAPRLIAMDDLYPGWEGLRAGSNYLNQNVLNMISQRKTASYQIWDWGHGQRGNPEEPGNGWREFSGGTPLIIEGCGSISRFSQELSSLSIWIDCELEVRKARLGNRDGGKFDQYWAIWAAQEDEFYESENSKALASYLLYN